MEKPCRGAAAPALSIVVPVTGDVPALEATLVSVLENRPDDAEIVVALGCDYADPWNIGEEVRFVDAPRGGSLTACTNAGIATAAGRVIHVLAAGWQATPGWTDKPLAHFDRGGVAAVVPLVVTAADAAWIESAGIRTTRGGRRIVNGRGAAPTAERLPSPSAPTLEAGFWSADLLAACGGFATACGDMLADADMAAAIQCSGGRVVLEADAVVLAGPSTRTPGAFTAGLQAERLFWRSLAAAPMVPAILGHLGEIVRHAVATAPLSTAAMLAGRLAGLVHVGDHAARSRQLKAIRQEFDAPAEARTLRIDRGHAEPSPPHGEVHATPLRRSA